MTIAGIVRSVGGWPRALVLVGLGVSALLIGTVVLRRSSVDPALFAEVQRGSLTATLTTSGTLRPIRSLTYRSPIAGREVEIRDLAPEGTRVNEGDLIVRLDTTELERELDRARQEFRQAQIDLQLAEGELEEAGANVKEVAEGEGALSVEEARSGLQRAEKKVERLRQELSQLTPLLDKGFITREELAKTRDQLEQAEEELALGRRRTDIVVQMSYPRERQRAAVQLAQKTSQLGNARTRLRETEARVGLIGQVIDACSVYALSPGMVVYEEYLSANPRRKLRVGDRVYSTQGIVTIPEVDRMLVESSVGEAEVRRVRPGQPAVVRVEAFPELRLVGKVTRVGTLASSSVNRPFDEKRFDLVINLDPTTADLRPEMTVRADITVGTREDVLLVPVTAVFERQGAHVVYVVGPTGAETRAIDLGESNDRMVEVVAGLREGERVALTAPATATSAMPGAAPGGNRPGSDAPQPR